jgi:hypothetical protein
MIFHRHLKSNAQLQIECCSLISFFSEGHIKLHLRFFLSLSQSYKKIGLKNYVIIDIAFHQYRAKQCNNLIHFQLIQFQTIRD